VRKLLFPLALLFVVFIVFIEASRLPADAVGNWLSSYFALGRAGAAEIPAGLLTPEQRQQINRLLQEKQGELDRLRGGRVKGLGIPALKFVDGILLFTLLLMGAGFLLPASILGRVQGVITLVFAILLVLAAIVTILAALAKLLLMVALLLSIPFGTLVYLILYGSFPKGATLVMLSLLFSLKLLFCAVLVLAHQRYLENKGLVLLILTTLVVNLVFSFLFGLLPGILASIVDAVAAIIAGIVAVIWAIILIIGAIVAIILALKMVPP
jgi:hypothetical protein